MSDLPILPDLLSATLAEAKDRIAQAKAQEDTDTLHHYRREATSWLAHWQHRQDGRELADAAGEIKVRAEHALAQIDVEVAPHGGDRASSGGVALAPLAELHHTTRAEIRKLAPIDEETLDGLIIRARADELRSVTTAHILDLEAGLMGGLKAHGIVEWYTPARYIEAARAVMGGIDLDPATSELANRTVKAERIYTAADDGLEQEWHGRIWLNPPYGKGSGLFTTKLIEEFYEGRVTQAVLLLNAYGFDAGWFQPLWDFPICFTDHRIQFTSPQRETGGPANGNIFAYLGPSASEFAEGFRQFGQIVRAWP